jgi:hypothetical protein
MQACYVFDERYGTTRYEEVAATGAEPLRYGWKRVPADGWREITLDEANRLVQQASESIKRAQTKYAHEDAQLFHGGAIAARLKAEAGERVFCVHDGDKAVFAGTNTKKQKGPIEYPPD